MTTTLATADGWFKETFGEAVDTVPEFAILRERVKFRQEERTGDSYNFPVRLRRSHGWTMASGATAGTAFALNAVRTGQMKNATLAGSSFVMRESFAYKAVASATAAGKQAFGNLLDDGVEDMLMTTNGVLELMLRYGGTNLGVTSTAGAASSPQTFTITAATAAPGLWALLEGAPIDAYDPTLVTKRNATGPIIVESVEYVPASGVVTLSLSGATADLDAILANDVFVLLGQVGGSMDGLDKIATNTGNLFGIDAATYSTWKANSATASAGALTMAKAIKATGQIAMRVGQSPLACLVSIQSWSDLNNDTAAIRRLVKNEGTVELGAKNIIFHGPTGPLEIIPDALTKGGEFFVVDFAEFRRVGATDVTFNLPGVDGKIANDRFFRELADNAGFEIRSFWDQALICRKPRTICKGTGVVNSVG